jgi:hypothetical protein
MGSKGMNDERDVFRKYKLYESTKQSIKTKYMAILYKGNKL